MYQQIQGNMIYHMEYILKKYNKKKNILKVQVKFFIFLSFILQLNILYEIYVFIYCGYMKIYS